MKTRRQTKIHIVAIARPVCPGGPYVVTCSACSFMAEAYYAIPALVGAYGHMDGSIN